MRGGIQPHPYLRGIQTSSRGMLPRLAPTLQQQPPSASNEHTARYLLRYICLYPSHPNCRVSNRKHGRTHTSKCRRKQKLERIVIRERYVNQSFPQSNPNQKLRDTLQKHRRLVHEPRAISFAPLAQESIHHPLSWTGADITADRLTPGPLSTGHETIR